MRLFLRFSIFIFLFFISSLSQQLVATSEAKSSSSKESRLIVLAGNSSAGKSTLAGQICKQDASFRIVSIDAYFSRLYADGFYKVISAMTDEVETYLHQEHSVVLEYVFSLDEVAKRHLMSYLLNLKGVQISLVKVECSYPTYLHRREKRNQSFDSTQHRQVLSGPYPEKGYAIQNKNQDECLDELYSTLHGAQTFLQKLHYASDKDCLLELFSQLKL